MAKHSRQQSKVAFAPSSPAPALRLKASRGLVALLIVLPAVLVFGAGFAGYWAGRLASAAAAVPPTPSSANNDSASPAVRVGPWGALSAQPITLELPEESLAAVDQLISAPPRWVFNGFARHRVLALFASAGLSAAEQHALSEPGRWQIEPQRIVITPPPDVVVGLAPAAHAIIYTVLAQFPENLQQQAPFFWRAREEAELLAHPAFSPEARELLRQLSYPKGNLMLFADWSVFVQKLAVPEAKRREMLQVLSRRPATVAKLHLTPETDLDAMMRYWGVAGLTKVMQPALEAVTRIPQGRTVPFLAVLPPFGRERLNTYPGATDATGQDSFWTAFNFFSLRPEPVVTDPAHWARKLGAEHFSVFADPRYGDILVIARPNGEVVQAAVYLADDLVFARTGATPWEPWVILSVADLLEVSTIRLAHQEIPNVTYYRNRIF
jgi:hypothetical protein